jgi:ferric-dicitrate binding protein FerR (iron transport regulator)
MNDEDIDLVLKSAGPRERPPPEIERKVRGQLRGEWLAMVSDKRRDRRRQTYFALAAGVLAAAIGVWIASPRPDAPADPFATMTLAAGEVRVDSGWFSAWRDVAPGQSLAVGQVLKTGPSGRGALALPGGVSARLDHDTKLHFTGAGEVTLERGALYVDAGPAASAASRLDVITPSGSVRHVGTQYEVRLLADAVRLRVREGRVEWHARTGGFEQSASGEELLIAGDGTVERLPMPAYGEDWDWAAATAPGIEIEGLPLSRFLSWAGRELGREISYATPETAADVTGIVVHGSIAGLTPGQALDAVLATTRMRAVTVDGRIIVGSDRPAPRPTGETP